jgi:hypothetical protein
MTSIADSSVSIQTSSESVPSTPVGWGKWCFLSSTCASRGSLLPLMSASVLHGGALGTTR